MDSDDDELDECEMNRGADSREIEIITFIEFNKRKEKQDRERRVVIKRKAQIDELESSLGERDARIEELTNALNAALEMDSSKFSGDESGWSYIEVPEDREIAFEELLHAFCDYMDLKGWNIVPIIARRGGRIKFKFIVESWPASEDVARLREELPRFFARAFSGQKIDKSEVAELNAESDRRIAILNTKIEMLVEQLEFMKDLVRERIRNSGNESPNILFAPKVINQLEVSNDMKKYKNVGVVVDKGKVRDVRVNQKFEGSGNGIDPYELGAELRKLKEKILADSSRNVDPDEISNLVLAENEAESGNSGSALEYLSKLGKETLVMARDGAAGLLKEAIMSAIKMAAE